jgi:hypothetical protein
MNLLDLDLFAPGPVASPAASSAAAAAAFFAPSPQQQHLQQQQPPPGYGSPYGGLFLGSGSGGGDVVAGMGALQLGTHSSSPFDAFAAAAPAPPLANVAPATVLPAAPAAAPLGAWALVLCLCRTF